MTEDEKVIALQRCVYTPNCCVTGFSLMGDPFKVQIVLSNGVVLTVRLADLEVSLLEGEQAA